jgi:type III secretory pathway component EscV
MLMRISLIVAIIAGLAAGALSFIKVKEKIDGVVTERNEWNQKYVTTDAELTTTKGTLAKTEKDLTKTKDSLVKAEQERAAALAEAEVLTKKSNELTEKLAKTIQERDDAGAKLASYEATGFTPPQIVALGKQLQQAKDEYEVSLAEKKIIERELEKTKERLYALIDPDHVVRMRGDMRGKVLIADPKWEFVVLSVGEEEGAKLNGELLVSRNGRLVAKIIIREVQKGRAIANMMPGWKLGDVAEGDQVIPANPES